MKPDWKDAPEWANWLAMDESGEWWWFDIEPEICLPNKCWLVKKASPIILAITNKNEIDWKKTKEKRP